jgi:uncharacterized radical SAM superfamily protein
MEQKLKLEEWKEIVRSMKDKEVQKFKTEQLATNILDFVRTTKVTDKLYFKDKRGKDYTNMKTMLKEKSFEEDAIQRMLDNEDFWNLTLEFQR